MRKEFSLKYSCTKIKCGQIRDPVGIITTAIIIREHLFDNSRARIGTVLILIKVVTPRTPTPIRGPILVRIIGRRPSSFERRRIVMQGAMAKRTVTIIQDEISKIPPISSRAVTMTTL